MELGLFTQRPTVDATIADVQAAAEAGFASVWMPQIFGIDTLTTLAIAAREVPNLKFGTAVIPTFPRHPMMLAAQARTVQQIAGGRFTLGIGLSHQMVIENMLGMSWEKPVRHLREYLDVLLPLVRGEAADATGETLSAHLELDIPDSTPIEVLVAALGTQMLNVTGRLAEGTGTWMTGPETIRTHIAPTINAAAAGAGRPTPRIVCSLPVCVTDDVADSRAKAAEEFLVYGFLPSYRSMLDLEGVEGPADVAIIGDANTVRAGIERIMEAGATEFVAVPFSNREATIEVLQSMM